MKIKIIGAKENNLKNINVEFSDGLTVVTGISGSGKSSLVYDTLYHEARRRFIDIFTSRSSPLRLPKAKVESLTGISPAVAVDQNVLNRNPNSLLASASGIHPFLRILYARFGVRFCPQCHSGMIVYSEDAIIEKLIEELKESPFEIFAPITRFAKGSHKTLLNFLRESFGTEKIFIDGKIDNNKSINPLSTHTIEIKIAKLTNNTPLTQIRKIIHEVFDFGISIVIARKEDKEIIFNKAQTCVKCGYWFKDLEPKFFHMDCEFCKGEGCEVCQNTGMHHEAAAVRLNGKRFPELLSLSVEELLQMFNTTFFPKSAERLKLEITRRLKSLQKVGLGYLSLNRPSPTLSRGEAQRVRLAIILTSHVEDMLHVLDEPTIGQHPFDVANFLPSFKDLTGPVVFIEHDRMAARLADDAIEIGPGAGEEGGKIIFTGSPEELWKQETPTGKYFSFREKVKTPELRPNPKKFLKIKGANYRNLKNIDISIPLGAITVITGVSGSGKSTFVEDVLVASLKSQKPIGCNVIEGEMIKPILVDQSPIGINPRSNPATYTNLADILRDIFSEASGLSKSHFTFNRSEGQCEKCSGIGAEEVKMPYIAPIWVPCEKCHGKRFKEEVLNVEVDFKGNKYSIGDFYNLSVREATPLILESSFLTKKNYENAKSILYALIDIGLGYLHLGQPSPTLSGGEAQRVKLAKYLGKKNLTNNLLVLDEPSTGLHPQDISGLLIVLDRLVRAGATIVLVEHNTDIIRATDWVIDLGPGAGINGGEVIFTGTVDDLRKNKKSLTGKAILDEEKTILAKFPPKKEHYHSDFITIKGARANNLKNINVNIPKGKLTVVTGLSGSGKSSLVTDVLELEAHRRFLESLSLYERQGLREGPEAPVDSITGLGVTAIIRSGIDPWRIDPRYSVGTAVDYLNYLFYLHAYLGERTCITCGSKMTRSEKDWICLKCHTTQPFISPELLSPVNLSSCCPKCKGLGFTGKPNINKLIIHPEKPICNGAMYSPGFWPQGFYCKPLNSAYYQLQAIAKKYNFNPATTPWNDIPEEAKNIFLYGSKEPWEYESEGRRGKSIVKRIEKRRIHGIFHAWGGFDFWSFGDLYETYSDKFVCPECNGQKLRKEYLTLTLKGYNIHQLRQLPLKELLGVLQQLTDRDFIKNDIIKQYWERLTRRISYLLKVGLGYLNTDRAMYTLSAGEYERLRLASVLDSGLTSLTLLLDEPSRGLHPSEVKNLVEILEGLRKEGNTVIVVEHDPEIIKAADNIIDMGPGAGVIGGEVIAQGSLDEIKKTNTLTAKWLKGERKTNPYRSITNNQQKLLAGRNPPKKWLVIKGAKENNLRCEEVKIPLGVLTGVCGVSGSGKSTLIIDTLGRALVSKRITTSIAGEEWKPGVYSSIKGAPENTLLIDQSKKKIYSPMNFFDLFNPLVKIFIDSEEASALGVTEKNFKENCTNCYGRGSIKMDMGFLPSIFSTCDICKGSGFSPEIWDVKVKGYSLPEVTKLTIKEVYELFKNDNPIIARILKTAIDFGLDYLVLKQPGYTLSGGEAQRMKIVKELCKERKEESLFILDEPSIGQHLEDIERLISILHKLVDDGHSVIVVEHHPNILTACDWLIELGPEGGPNGGMIIASGTPEQIAKENTPTAPYIKNILEGKI